MNILVGYDGSNASRDALNIAMAHARAFEAKLYVVTSLAGGPDSGQEDIDQAKEHLAEVESLLSEEEIPFETRLLIQGRTPGEDIVLFSKENEIAEVVVGVRRRSKVSKILMGSTAQYVILKAPCPVVCVK